MTRMDRPSNGTATRCAGRHTFAAARGASRMASTLKLLSIVVLAVAGCPQAAAASNRKCAFMGRCHFDRDSRKAVPCAVDASPQATLSDAQWKSFQQFCPDLASTTRGRKLCCDAEQFETLKKEMRSVDAIGMPRCKGCYRAFRNLMCQMTCSPHQAHFIAVNATRPATESTLSSVSESAAVGEIVYAVSRSFATNLYQACHQATSNLFVRLTTLMCGVHGRNCSPERFLEFLGFTPDDGGYSPFRIRHVLLDDADTVAVAGTKKKLTAEQWTAAAAC